MTFDPTAHRVTVAHDEGLVRHLIVDPKKSALIGRVHVTTWPGHLAVSGDMSDFIFARYGTEDMLKFFRGQRPNVPYWTEKLRAEPKGQPARVPTEEPSEENDWSPDWKPSDHYGWVLEMLPWAIAEYDQQKALTVVDERGPA